MRRLLRENSWFLVLLSAFVVFSLGYLGTSRFWFESFQN